MTIEELAKLWKNVISSTNEAGILTWPQKEAENKFFPALWAFEKEHPETDAWAAIKAAL